MDAIKKKMQAMKVEKDNACDRSDQVEEASKAARLRAEKAEDEVAELNAKARQLETELDLTTERLGIVSLQLEEKEKSLMAAEAMNALNERVFWICPLHCSAKQVFNVDSLVITNLQCILSKKYELL